jgi:hypothetical protein
MPENTGTIIEAQVDWLTVSAHGERKAQNLLALGKSLEAEQRALGNKRRAWKMMGYVGTHCGAVEHGAQGTDHAELRLIGDLADRELTKALSAADLVTRCDIAVTWRAEPADPLLGQNAWALATMHHAAKPRSALPWRVTDANGGYTVYLGARGSEQMLRIYHKGAEAVAKGSDDEQEKYKDCWRYELECKGSISLPLADRVNSHDDRTTFVQQYLYEWCQRHGVEPAFPFRGSVAIIPGFRRRSDSDSKLRHLAKNVRPTVEWLASEGKLDLARKALGLD